VESSLRRLGTDWIDLYQLHRADPHTPIVETLGVLSELVTEGKIRYAGVCNLAGWQIADAAWIARTEHLAVPIAAQNHYSLLEREAERDVNPAARRFGLGVLPYFPLANGLLTGKYRRDTEPPAHSRLAGRRRLLLSDVPWDRLDQLRTFANERAIAMTTLAISWLAAQNPVSSVIAGATTPDQVAENAAAVKWRPSPKELAVIDEICPPGRR
jgi:aryl-alcohol dehydrogenase-like predicted oxidoreductase